jgi:hypothetical protein
MKTHSAQLLARTIMVLASLSPAAIVAAQDRPNRFPNKPSLPEGSSAVLELRNIVNTRTAFVGEQFYCTTINPMTAENRILIPAGSFVRGYVTQIERPRKVKGKTKLALRFDMLTLPNGTTKPLQAAFVGIASMRTDLHLSQREVVSSDSNWRSDLASIATNSSQTAIVGAMSGMSAGDSGLWSGVAGGGSGIIRLAYLLTSRSEDFVLTPGTSLEIRLEAPLVFSAGEIESTHQSAQEFASIPN